MRRRRRDLDDMVEALLAGQALPPGRLGPGEAEALKAAIELRAARPGADVPDEAFVTDLRRRLRRAASESATATARAPRGIPRRAVLAAAAGAVAAGVVGAVAESALGGGTASAPAATGPIVPADGHWVAVAAAADVEGGRVQRFATASTVGFVSRREGTLSAVSGACTHQGCLLRLDPGGSRLDCPCHRTGFGVDGKLLFSQLDKVPADLPHIQVRDNGGQVEALLPKDV